MYKVADNMKRLEYIAEMKISAYTDDDIEYMNYLLKQNRELISEGAALTLYASCKYLIGQIVYTYHERCLKEPYSVEIPTEVRLAFYSLSRKKLPELLQAYNEKYGDIDVYISKNICILYENVLNSYMGIKF